jgi:hemerythrin
MMDVSTASGGGRMAFQWTEDLRTGVDDIDAQHMELILHINALLDACSHQKGKDDIGSFLGYLSEYVAFHFAAEEREMTRYHFPGLAAHEQEHEQFKKVVGDLKRKFARHGAGINIVLMTMRSSCDWLVNHIKKTDKEMAEFLKLQCAAT